MTTRIVLEVHVDLDDTPGAMHSKESARNLLQGLLTNNMTSYRPVVDTTTTQYVVDKADHQLLFHFLGRDGYWRCTCTEGGFTLDSLIKHESKVARDKRHPVSV